jgi:hypothetical protein
MTPLAFAEIRAPATWPAIYECLRQQLSACHKGLRRGFWFRDESCVQGGQKADFGNISFVIILSKAWMILASVTLALSASSGEEPSKWISLFNGKVLRPRTCELPR